MNPPLEFLQGPEIARLGWTLVHFLWQGTVMTVCFAAIRATIRKTSPNARYLAGCLTLLLMAVCVVGTFAMLGPGSLVDAVPSAARVSASQPGSTAPTAAFPPAPSVSPSFTAGSASTWQAVEAGLPWVVGLWALGVSLFSLRLAGGWLKVRQTRRASRVPPDDPLCQRFRELRQRLRVNRHVRLMKSALVRVPTVVGWFRPLVILPTSTLSGLSPVQLDLILAHELAHLRRWDHWVNLGQLLLETVLFYHPAVWWVSRCVREDREHCCDELAVAACGNRLAFAQALTALEELRQAHSAFTLAATDGSLLARVRRILALPDDERGGIDRRAAGSALLALGLLMFASGAVLYATSPRLCTAGLKMKLYRPSQDEDWHLDYFSTAAGYIQSQRYLLSAIRRLAHEDGASTDEEPSPAEVQLLQTLRSQLNVRGTSKGPYEFVEMELTRNDTEHGVGIVQALAEDYLGRVEGGRKARLTSGIEILRNKLAEQEAQVADLQGQLDDLRIRLHIPDTVAHSDNALYSVSTERERLSTLLQALQQARSELVYYSSKLKALETLGTDNVRGLRDAIVTALEGERLLALRLDDLDKVEQNLAKLLSSSAPEHPEVQATMALRTVVQTQVSNRIAGLLEGLRANVNAFQARYGEVSNQVEVAKEAVAAEASAFSQYFQAKRQLEIQMRIRDAVHMRSIQESIDADLLTEHPAEILNPASIIRGPWRRSQPYDLWLMGGGLFMTLSGLVVRSRPKREDKSASPARQV